MNVRLEQFFVQVKVEHIKVQGLDKTKNDFVVHQCKDLFNAATFKDVILSCQEVKQKLEQANIFKTVSVLIDTSKGERALSSHTSVDIDST